MDSMATGANNGTNWANAWNSLSSIKWASVQAGKHSLHLWGKHVSGLLKPTERIKREWFDWKLDNDQRRTG